MKWQVYIKLEHNTVLQCLTMEGQGIGRGQQQVRRRERGVRLSENENLWPNRQERQEA